MKSLCMWFFTVMMGGGPTVIEQEVAILSESHFSRSLQTANNCLTPVSVLLGNLAATTAYFSVIDEWLYTDEEESTTESKYMIFSRVAMLLLGLGCLVFVLKKYKQTPLSFGKPLRFITNKKETSPYLDVVDEFLSDESEKRYITLEKEVAILKQIESFEQDKSFLDKSISLNVLAAKFGVNHRYLSYVVNKHKECDFATYINELRVMHIVRCLQQDPEYLKYKISYLAEQCGFASHSRFTVTFKKVTGDPPSTFINKLREENNM